MPGHEQDSSEQDGALEHGSSGSTADAAVEGRPSPETGSVDAPYARPATDETDPDDGLQQRRDH